MTLVLQKVDSEEKHYTYRDYLKFTFDEVVEIIKGKIFKMSPAPVSAHQIISSNLSLIIGLFIKRRKCTLIYAPFDVILPVRNKDVMEADTVVQPDICVICDPSKIKVKGCFGAPDWIIEIISPGSVKKDVQIKFDLYEESGVKEYWVIDPFTKMVEVFVLSNSRYQRIGAYVEDDIVPCHIFPELKIDLKEVFEGIDLISLE